MSARAFAALALTVGALAAEPVYNYRRRRSHIQRTRLAAKYRRTANRRRELALASKRRNRRQS
jgi:hypothetical protein